MHSLAASHTRWQASASLLLASGVTISVEGAFDTYFRAGKLFPGPHLFAGAGAPPPSPVASLFARHRLCSAHILCQETTLAARNGPRCCCRSGGRAAVQLAATIYTRQHT